MKKPAKRLIEVAARNIDPVAFKPYERSKLGCQSGWHWEGHGFHSTCPSCGRNWTTTEEAEEGKLERRRAKARAQAELALVAALPLVRDRRLA